MSRSLLVFRITVAGISGLLALRAEAIPVRVRAPGAPAGTRVELRPMASNFAWADGVLRGAEAPEPAVTARLDAGGGAQLEAPAAGVWEVEVVAPDSLPMRLRPLAVAGPAELPPISLLADRPLRFRVLGEAGQPVVGAWVYAQTATPELWREAEGAGWNPARRFGRTDAAGWVSLPGAVGERLAVSAFLPGRWQPIVATLAEGGTLHGQGGGAPVTLVVRGEAGEALEGVAVLAGSPPWPVGRTDEGGRLTLAGAAAAVPIELFAADGRRQSAELPVGRAEVGLTLAATKPMAGVVRQEGSGRALGQALVWLGHDPARWVLSDPTGRFALAAPPLERFWVQGAAAAHLPAGVRVRAAELAPGREVVLPLPAAASLLGRAVDGEGRAIAGVEVSLLGAAALPPRVTDTRGAFELGALPAGRFYDLRLRRAGFSPLLLRRVRVPPEQPRLDLGDLRLAPAASLAGTVVGQGAGPVRGARVIAWPVGERAAAGEATTDAQGAFTVGDLTAGRRYRLAVAAEGYLPAEPGEVEVPAPRPLVIELEPAAALSGWVLDGAGQGISGAEVRLVPASPPAGVAGLPRSHLEETAARSGADGSFTLSGLAAGPATLSAAAEGFAPSAPLAVEVASGEQQAGLVLVLREGAVLTGAVRDRRGEPIAGARISASGRSAVSDREGAYRLAGLPEGRLTVTVRHAGYNDGGGELTIEPGAQAEDFVLRGGLAASGVVTDEEGRRVAGARVEMEQSSAFEHHTYRTLADEDGAFLLAPVASGTYELTASHPGYAEGRDPEPLELTADRDGLELRLNMARRISGAITGVARPELARLAVAAKGEGGREFKGEVDHLGAYEIPDLPAGEYLVRAALEGGEREAVARVALRGEVREVRQDLDLGGGLALTGLATYQGLPLASARISLRGTAVSVERGVMTDAAGRFRIEGLAAGPYRLTLVHPREQLIHNAELELDADREIHLEVATAEILGAVRSTADGRPLPEAMVLLYQLGAADGEPRSLFTVATNAAGFFTQARLAAGRYRVRVQKEGFVAHEEELRVEQGERLALSLALAPAQGLVLRIRLADGRAPAVASVAMVGTAGSSLPTLVPLAADGTAELASLPPGTWQLWLGAPGGVAGLFTATVPGEPLVAVLPQAARLRVTVASLMATNRAATVSLRGPDGRPFVGLGAAGEPASAWPLAGGSGVIEGIAAGTWQLTIEASDGQRWQGIVVAEAGAEVVAAFE